MKASTYAVGAFLVLILNLTSAADAHVISRITNGIEPVCQA